MRICSGISIADDDFGTSLEDRTYEVSDPISRVLIIAVSIDDDVCAEHQTVHDTVMKSYAQTSVGLEFDNMVYTESTSHFRRIVSTSIVDDEVFYAIYPWYVFWEVVKCRRESFSFIFAGDLDDEFDHKL